MRVRIWIAALAALAVVGSPLAMAKNNKAKPPGHAAKQSQGNSRGSFSPGDFDIVRSFFIANPVYRGSPLPPGIAKNYARGKPLPPGIAKKVVPYDLLVRLPERPGHTYFIVDDDIVLIAIATGVVVDIMIDVFG
jgi:Ni/Co efflux regulator RcnB